MASTGASDPNPLIPFETIVPEPIACAGGGAGGVWRPPGWRAPPVMYCAGSGNASDPPAVVAPAPELGVVSDARNVSVAVPFEDPKSGTVGLSRRSMAVAAAPNSPVVV